MPTKLDETAPEDITGRFVPVNVVTGFVALMLAKLDIALAVTGWPVVPSGMFTSVALLPILPEAMPPPDVTGTPILTDEAVRIGPLLLKTAEVTLPLVGIGKAVMLTCELIAVALLLALLEAMTLPEDIARSVKLGKALDTKAVLLMAPDVPLPLAEVERVVTYGRAPVAVALILTTLTLTLEVAEPSKTPEGELGTIVLLPIVLEEKLAVELIPGASGMFDVLVEVSVTVAILMDLKVLPPSSVAVPFVILGGEFIAVAVLLNIPTLTPELNERTVGLDG